MIPVYYVPDMVAPNVHSFAPGAMKPKQVVSDWKMDVDIAPDIEILPFDPVSQDDIAAAHDLVYVREVLSCRQDNGFGNRDTRMAQSLPFTSGSMVAAASHVLQDIKHWDSGSRIACSPSSGFHHAHFEAASGFCTFNGLIVTLLALKRQGLIDRALILDCDQHYGDGTQDIIERLGLDWIAHVTHGGSLPGSYRSKASMMGLIERFMTSLASEAPGRSVVLYQAGADCHVDDPLGGFLTTDEMRERDRLVFWLAVQLQLPLAWNLAGGYQRDRRGTIAPVLQLHRQTMSEAIIAQAWA